MKPLSIKKREKITIHNAVFSPGGYMINLRIIIIGGARRWTNVKRVVRVINIIICKRRNT